MTPLQQRSEAVTGSFTGHVLHAGGCYEGYFPSQAVAAAAAASSGDTRLCSICTGFVYQRDIIFHVSASNSLVLLSTCVPGGSLHTESKFCCTVGRHLLGSNHCEGCEYHKYCNSHAAAAAAAASGGDATAAAVAASTGMALF